MLYNNFLILISIICTIEFGSSSSIANNNICPKSESSLQEITTQKLDLNEACFDIQPYEYDSNKKAQQQKSVVFECYVKNKGSLSVAWLHDNQLISLNDQVIIPDSNILLDTDSSNKFNLKLENVDINDKGSYRCQIISKATKNLEYNLDILVPPSITRIPNKDVITLSEGDSLTVQCLTQGNPRPKLTWSKTGEKAVHTTIDELKSSLTLENLGESHADTYSCTAKNGVGNPVTSEFQVLIKFKPRVRLSEQEYIKKNIVYSAVGKKDQIKCIANAYPSPKMSLLLNNVLVSDEKYTFEESSNKQFVLTYNFIGSTETFGDFKCVAENKMGVSSTEFKVTPLTSDVSLSSDKLPVYSDAAVLEWSLHSGSPVQELNIQVFNENSTNVTNLVSKTKQMSTDGTESLPTYHNENIFYRDYYDLTKLSSNRTYLVRLRARNEFSEWSEWSQNVTVRTHSDEDEKIIKHKSAQMNHHNKHHDKKYKNYAQQTGSRDLNGKRDRFNSYSYDKNSGFSIRQAINAFSVLLATIGLCYLIL